MPPPAETPPDAVTILICPTHVATNLRGGRTSKLRAAADRYAVDGLLLTEVQSPLARIRLALAFPRRRWIRSGTRPPSWGRGSPGTIALARRTRFRRLASSRSRLVSKYRDRFHPERRTTWLDLLDKDTHREWRWIPLHPWTLGRNVPDWARQGHNLQVDRYEQAALDAGRAGMGIAAGGDVNEDVNGDGSSPVEQAMTRAGLKIARPRTDHQQRIVEAWVSRTARVPTYRLLPASEVGSDHVAILLTVDPR